MRAKKLFYKECRLAGRMYHDADFVFEQLHVGTRLHLVRDTENLHDPDAVAVFYHADEKKYLLGYIPGNENEELARFLDMGWGNLFNCRISHICPEAHYEQQIRLVIRINRNNSKESC